MIGGAGELISLRGSLHILASCAQGAIERVKNAWDVINELPPNEGCGGTHFRVAVYRATPAGENRLPPLLQVSGYPGEFNVRGGCHCSRRNLKECEPGVLRTITRKRLPGKLGL
jgi:hypothetical protein